MLEWVQSFLSSRTQEVILEGKKSSPTPVTSGVPQGSVLAPILFLCYINDLPNQVSSTVRLFADDCLLYRSINTTHDAETLQEDIDKLQTWEADWLMEFNPDKCEIIRITNRRKTKIVTNYSIHEHQLKEVKGVKYLGVTIDRTLSWNEHINNVTKKANNTRAFLQRNINRCPEAVKTLCYQAFVRPIVEYASTVWDPSTEKKHQICGERAATGFTLREERLPTTQQCDHHAGKLELGVPCEQAGGSQARNVVSNYKQLSRRVNIRTHSRAYTHHRQHTPLLTTIHPHRSLQTLLLSKHHQIMEQMHTTIS